MSYANDARFWWAKSKDEQDKAARISDWFLDKAAQRIESKIRTGQLRNVDQPEEVRREHERLLEGEAGKYRRSHLTAALAFAQYASTCGVLALMDQEGI